MNHYAFFVSCSLLLISCLATKQLLAQNELSQKVDSLVQTCIQSDEEAEEVLGEDFGFFEWAQNFQEYLGKALYDSQDDVLSEIADQKEPIAVLHQLCKTCEGLDFLAKDMKKLEKIFDEEVKIKSSESTSSSLNFQSSREIELTVGGARKLKVYVNSLVNRVQGDDSIFRIFR